LRTTPKPPKAAEAGDNAPMKPTKSTSLFTRLTKRASHAAGRPTTFLLALGIVLIWALCGPYFGFSDTWQLVINTGTTVITFLMVFLIQSTQNRDSEAMHLKLDELIRSIEGAHNALLDLEELDEKDLIKIRSDYLEIARSARMAIGRGEIDTGRVELKGGRPR
jgi:low affinity Fe/Cu permease